VLEIKSKFFPHLAQQKIRESNARFRIVIAGRRFGKSVLAVNECIEYALANPDVKVWYCSPFYKQTKEIAWNIFKFYLPKEFIDKVNESDLKFTLVNGSEIALKGTDNPDALVGVGLKFCVLDEFAMMKAEIWKQVVRPMLIDSKGKCLFISTPRGFNWAYDFYKAAQHDEEFDTFQFRTVDNTTVQDIEAEVNKAKNEATSELDRITFRQEYEATFEVVTGRPRFSTDIISKWMAVHTEGVRRSDDLYIFEPIDKLAKYIIGVDTSEGLIGGDRSTAVILNAKTFAVSAYYAGHIAPDLLALAVRDWATEYNGALVVVEDNNHGLLTINELKRVYTHLYYRKVKDEVTDEWTEKVGWRTTNRTKPLLIGNLDKQLRAGLGVPSKEILNELMTYVIDEDGTTNASEGGHDDLVIGLALAVQGYLESEHSSLPEKPRAKDGTAQSFVDKVLQAQQTTATRYDGERKSFR
jgi:hypothetical protein